MKSDFKNKKSSDKTSSYVQNGAFLQLKSDFKNKKSSDKTSSYVQNGAFLQYQRNLHFIINSQFHEFEISTNFDIKLECL